MEEDIQYLFNHLDLFAKLITSVKLSNFKFEVSQFKKYEFVIDLIVSDKRQFRSNQEALAAIFKKELFVGEEWNIDEESSISDGEWIDSLTKYGYQNIL